MDWLNSWPVAIAKGLYERMQYETLVAYATCIISHNTFYTLPYFMLSFIETTSVLYLQANSDKFTTVTMFYSFWHDHEGFHLT